MKPRTIWATVESCRRRRISVSQYIRILRKSGLEPAYSQLFNIDNPAELQATAQHFGGERWWLVCPYCRRRATYLFELGGTDWECRQCAGLAYKSTRLSQADRHELRSRRIAGRIGGFLGELPANKPRWMRWKTFSRLYVRARELITELAEYERLTRLARSLDQLRRRVR